MLLGVLGECCCESVRCDKKVCSIPFLPTYYPPPRYLPPLPPLPRSPLTLLTSHLLRSPLNELASSNMPVMSVTCAHCVPTMPCERVWCSSGDREERQTVVVVVSGVGFEVQL